MPVTTRIIIPDSGSSVNAQGTSNEPMPPAVSSGMGGIQAATVTWWKRSSPGRPRSCANAATDSSSDAAIVPQAT